MILSKSMTGAMWKSNTKYWRRQTFKNDSVEIVITNMWFDIGDIGDCEAGNLIVVRAVGAFLHRSELFGVAHLNVDSFKAMLSHQLIYQCYLIYLRKLSGYLCHHDHHLAGWWKYWKTWTQTTGSMLRPANCRASITVMHIWIKIIGIMIWQCKW